MTDNNIQTLTAMLYFSIHELLDQDYDLNLVKLFYIVIQKFRYDRSLSASDARKILESILESKSIISNNITIMAHVLENTYGYGASTKYVKNLMLKKGIKYDVLDNVKESIKLTEWECNDLILIAFLNARGTIIEFCKSGEIFSTRYVESGDCVENTKIEKNYFLWDK